ncbi:fibronectin type III domain-containing protein [Geomonas oryzae]|jgi:hypothetical protein|uniref:fibronectin type III domain-containing protein n=1 Tax=Geomonas oryzae TaxID=2364273 RepID=UPI00100C0A91|nr:fibronectin type III domain-containing protein [Geomonas oryzae]
MPFAFHPLSIFDTSFINYPHLECATHIIGIGEALIAHPLFQEVPAGAYHGNEIKILGTRYHDLTYAVMTGASGKKAERDAAREEALLATCLTLNWAGMRYLKEKNFELISNLGVDHRKKAAPRSTTTVLIKAPDKMKLEHGKISGTLRLVLGKVEGAVTYFVQACQGDPNDEAAWLKEWQFTKIKGGVELTGLEPGKIYYIRVRCLGHAGYGPWSTYVHIMVV